YISCILSYVLCLSSVNFVRALYISFLSFNSNQTTDIDTLSLHDALPILKKAELMSSVSASPLNNLQGKVAGLDIRQTTGQPGAQDRKSTRLNSSHVSISYAVFCLKKKKHSMLLSCESLSSYYVLLLHTIH